MRKYLLPITGLVLCFLLIFIVHNAAYAASPEGTSVFPLPLDRYNDSNMTGVLKILLHRIGQNPFNLLATLIFLCAIIHTFLTSKFLAIAHKLEAEHEKKIRRGKARKNSVNVWAGVFDFLGEVEAVFGIWAIALAMAIVLFYDWGTMVNYLSHGVNFTEAMFVVTIMTLASTRPILKFTESCMQWIANKLGGTLTAWWLTLLTVGPVLGSFITEPAAMTITAILLSHKLYDLNPSEKFKYATIGLLFVNISIGGTFTHFAAPPVLMVAESWQWGTLHMLSHFGWKALMAMILSNSLYFFIFNNELEELQKQYIRKSIKDDLQKEFLSHSDLDEEIDHIILDDEESSGIFDSLRNQIEKKSGRIKQNLAERLKERHLDKIMQRGLDEELVKEAFNERFEEIKLLRMRRSLPVLLPENQRLDCIDPEWDKRDDPVPGWITGVHVAFMLWTIINAHHPALFIAGLLFFLGFAQVTSPFQNTIDLRPPLLVGFFLSGLVILGGLQGWWIAPVLSSLGKAPLLLASTVLTSFNDNAAITFLATLVPDFTDIMKHAVVAGAAAGGGLTVIANAPNPAGQALLKKYFKNGVSPAGLLKAALLPTIISWMVFYVFM